MEVRSDSERRRFVWGVRLAWGCFLLLFLPSLIQALRGLAWDKATGLGAVAGGLSEAFLMFGLVSAVVLQAVALLFLARPFSMQHAGRAVIAVASMACSVFILATAVVAVWFSFFR